MCAIRCSIESALRIACNNKIDSGSHSDIFGSSAIFASLSEPSNGMLHRVPVYHMYLAQEGSLRSGSENQSRGSYRCSGHILGRGRKPQNSK